MNSCRGNMFGILGLAVLLAAQSHAQSGGTVNFANNSSCKVLNAQTGNPVTTNDNVRAALYWGPPGAGTLVQVGASVQVGVPLPGLFAGGTRTSGIGTPGGSSGQFQVRAWGGGFSSYEEAERIPGVLIGQSAILQGATGNPEASPPTPPASLVAHGLQSFALVAVPPAPPVITGPIQLQGGQFQFTVNSAPGRWVEVQASPDLSHWTTLASFINIPGTMPWSTPATNTSRCFYRLRQLP